MLQDKKIIKMKKDKIYMKMEKVEKFEKILKVFLGLFIAIAMLINVKALECSGTLSHPNPVNLGEPFNVSFFNAMPGWYGTAELIWNPKNGLINLTENHTSTSPFTVSIWTLNSTQPGEYNISVIVTNNATNQTCIKNSSVLVVFAGRPFLTMQISMPGLTMYVAKSKTNFSVNVSNIGNDTAKNVTTYFIGQNVEPSSKYLGNIENGTSRIDNYTITFSTCGRNVLEGKTIYDDYYYANDTETFEVYGSDLAIESFTVSNTNVHEDDNIVFNVTVKNIERGYSTNATNVKVKIYRSNNVIATIDFGDVGVGEIKSKTATWKASGVGKFTPIAKVDSDQECSNWDNNEYSGPEIRIREKEEAGGAGGGGGGGAGGGEGPQYVCGNGICETNLGENSTNCPQDCLIIPQQPTPREGYIEIVSDDGLVILKISKRAVIEDKEGNRLNASEIKIEKVKDIQLIPSLPEGIYLIRAYKITPEVSFDVPAQLIFKYNEEIPKDVDANLFIYKFVGDWIKLEAVWDKEDKKLITEIHSTSIYALVTDKPLGFLPITGAVIGVIDWIKTNWWVILATALIVVVILLIILLIKRKQERK